jgi:uncharacterized membrane protein
VLTHNVLDVNELQEEPREWLKENNKVIHHPFYVIEICDIAESFYLFILMKMIDPIVRTLNCIAKNTMFPLFHPV